MAHRATRLAEIDAGSLWEQLRDKRMAERAKGKGGQKAAPKVLRFIGVVSTFLALLSVVFILILMETRDKELSVRRDVAYGELNRIENRLEDLISVAEAQACAGGSDTRTEEIAQDEVLLQAGDTEKIEQAKSALAEPREVVENEELSKLAPDCDVKLISLTNESRQSRDRRLVLTVLAETKTNGTVKLGKGQWPDVSDEIGSDTLGFEVPDVAIVSSEFRPILRLRGDTGWPAELGRIVAEGEAVGWDGLEVSEAVTGEGDKRSRVTEFAALSGPVSIRLGGAERIAHAVPLSARLPIVVGGPSEAKGGFVCKPRNCLVVGLTREQGMIEDFSRISPLMRASFGATIVLLLLLVPLAKLVFIEKRSSLHWSDVAALICSVPLAIAAMFVISLCWSQWLELRAEYDRDAMRIAQMVSQDIERETESLHRALLPCSPGEGLGLVDDVYLVGANGDLLSRDPSQIQGVDAAPDEGTDSPQPLVDKECSRTGAEPGPTLARFVGRRNDEQENAAPTSVASREYFRTAAQIDPDKSASNARHNNIVTDIVFSRVDGLSTMIAIRPFFENRSKPIASPPVRFEPKPKPKPKSESNSDENREQVTARPSAKDFEAVRFLLATKNPDSTRRAKLPADFQFALLDKDTLEVLQHSEASRNGSEFWDKRIGDVGQLKEAMGDVQRQCPTVEGEPGRQPHFIESDVIDNRLVPSKPATMSYAGRDVRISLRPMCSLGWVMAAWYPTASTEQLAVEAGIFPIAIILTIAGFAILMSIVAGLSDSERLLAYFWPIKPKPIGSQSTERKKTDEIEPILTRGRKALLMSGLFILMLGQTLIIRGDAAFWQIWAVLCVPIALSASPAVTDTSERKGRRNLFVVALLIYGVLSIYVASLMIGAGIIRMLGYSVLALLVGATLFLLPRASLPGATIRALLRSLWSKGGMLRRLVDRVRAWIDSHDNLSRQIVTQTLIQGVRVGLIAVLPAILAYRAATTPLFEDRIAADIAETRIEVAQLSDRQCDEWLERSVMQDGLRVDPEFIISCRFERMNGYAANPASNAVSSGFVFLPSDFTRMLLNQVVGRRLRSFEEAAIDASQINRLLRDRDADETELIATPAPESGRALPDRAGAGGPAIPRTTDREVVQRQLESDTFIATPVAGTPFDPIVRTFFQVLPFILFALAGLAIYAYLNRALFGMGLFEFRALHPRPRFEPKDLAAFGTGARGGPPPLRLYINYPFDKFDSLKNSLEELGGYNLIDLARIENAEAMFQSTAKRNKPWIVVGLMRVIGAPDLRRKALHFLERLTAVDGVQIHFFSEMLPIERLQQVRELERMASSEITVPETIVDQDEARHWAMLLARFVTIRWDSGWEDRSALKSKIVEGVTERCEWLDDLIEDEFEAIPNDLVRKQRESFLEEIELKSEEAEERQTSGRFGSLAYQTYAPENLPLREQVIEYLANVLSDYYQVKWIGSTREEQILMHHLAHGRFVKTTDFRTINGLINRDLIKRNPNLQLMNESFAFWIRTNENPQSFKDYRQMIEQSSAWSQLRFPMLVFVVLAAGALAYLDQGTVGSIISLIPAIAAAIPVFVSQAGQSRSVPSQ